MSWSKVNKKHRKPLKWWYYKMLCEMWWALGDRGEKYYKYLNKCCEQGFNLYGDKLLYKRL